MKVKLIGGTHDGKITSVQKDWDWIMFEKYLTGLPPGQEMPPDEFYRRGNDGNFHFEKQRSA